MPFPFEELGRALRQDPANTLRVQGQRHPNLRRSYKLRRYGWCRAPLRHLIGTAKLNDVDPQAWLADVLGRIAETPQNRLDELLPWNWVPEQKLDRPA